MEESRKTSIFIKIFHLATNRALFSVMYFIIAVLWSFPLIVDYFEFPMKFMFLWGIFIIVYDFLTKRIMFTGYKSFWLVLFGISYLITILTNTEQFYNGIKHFIYNGILIYIIYAFSSDKTEAEYKKWFVAVNDIITVITFTSAFVSIIMFMTRFTYVFTRGDMTFAQGLYYNRLHGVYTSANTGAIFSMLSLGITGVTYTFNKVHFKKFKCFYIINAVVQFIYYSLTLSRGGEWMLIAALIAASMVFVYPYFLKYRKKAVAVALSAVLLVTSFAVINGLTFVSRKAMLYLNNNIYSEHHSQSDLDNSSTNVIELERVDNDREVTNGRLTIWQAGLAILKQKPLFGVCESDVYTGDKLMSNIDEDRVTELNISELKRANGYMHNAVVQIVVCSGIIGLIIFAVFAVKVAKKYITSLILFHGTETYSSLAVIFVLLCMLLSQIASESHILFNRQDPYAILFWMYLGFGLFIIKGKHTKNNCENLFICGTPYQVMNAISIAEAQSENKSDIFIYKQFQQADQVVAELENSIIFKRVIPFNSYKVYPRVIQKVVTIFRILNPLYALRHSCQGEYKNCTYQYVYASYFTNLADSVRLMNPNAEFIQYEDGIGSYYINDIEDFARGRLFKFINNFFMDGRLSYNFRTIYLNHPECYDNSCNIEVRKIPPLENNLIFDKIFDYKSNDIYQDNRFVFLTQPLEETAFGKNAVTTEQTILSAIGDCAVIRIHPRQKRNHYNGYTVDDINNQWELECAKQITDSHILIGAFSTAQFTPKMLFDKEPTVIFTYKLYGDTMNDAEKMVEMLRSMYQNPEKIVVIEDIEQLTVCLS